MLRDGGDISDCYCYCYWPNSLELIPSAGMMEPGGEGMGGIMSQFHNLGAVSGIVQQKIG